MALYRVLRSLLLWMASGLCFLLLGPFLMVIGLVLDPRRVDWPLRFFARCIVFLSGMRLEVRRAPGFDPTRPAIFMSNHVNLFDPFVVYAAIPQRLRGLELESHFRIPVYGWIMKRVGNIPVVPGGSKLPHLQQQVKEYVDSGTSIIIFPEGKRTLDGTVGPFRKGGFVMAQQLQIPIVPVSMCGAYEFNRKGGFMLIPGAVVVHLHDTIEPGPYSDDSVADLVARVHRTVSQPVELPLDA